ncbi:hypothetical protein KY284_030095 [Solanum tuberosum]|nr:hypothetical protein KY284_030095 [Solanum tuberosum]
MVVGPPGTGKTDTAVQNCLVKSNALQGPFDFLKMLVIHVKLRDTSGCFMYTHVFTGQSFGKDMRSAKGCFHHLKTMFQLLESTVDRSNYLMTKQAKIVAMTCTHAALKRKDFLQVGFKYENLLMEDSAQILEIETFIPMLLQRQEDGYARLKRCILIGDHHQLPPVVKNMAFQKYSHMDQSLFTRFVRLGIPYIELNAQGRARLYNWRYRELGDLPYVKENAVFHKANA